MPSSGPTKQVKNFAAAQRDTAKSKADLARRALAAAHCFRQMYMSKASMAVEAGDPMPQYLMEDDVSELVPIITQSIGHIVGPDFNCAAAG